MSVKTNFIHKIIYNLICEVNTERACLLNAQIYIYIYSGAPVYGNPDVEASKMGIQYPYIKSNSISRQKMSGYQSIE